MHGTNTANNASDQPERDDLPPGAQIINGVIHLEDALKGKPPSSFKTQFAKATLGDALPHALGAALAVDLADLKARKAALDALDAVPGVNDNTAKPDGGQATEQVKVQVDDKATDINAQPVHDKEMARLQLAILDPDATSETQWVFQIFTDDKRASKEKKKATSETFYGTLDELWSKVLALNTPQKQRGIYVTINKTDGSGRRKAENITSPRGLFVDADNSDAVDRCEKEAVHVPPSMIVDTGNGSHYYWLRNDRPLDDGTPDPLPINKFTGLQDQLNTRLGTDKQVKDLPRVLRLAGTLHLKDPDNPRLIKLRNKPGEPVCRYTPAELLEKLEQVKR
jgi:hypothetical protein